MCGICGYLNCADEAALEAMLNRMVHRGPDEEGRHVEPGLGLGIRRLSIIDPEGGHQPAFNETRTVWVVQNGEIYNYRELREELIARGHSFTTRSDTEVIVHLYEEEGNEFVHRLRGMFAIALWDREQGSLLLVRDRLGIKPLYVMEAGKSLMFASEASAIREVRPETAIRPEAVVQYLTFLYSPAPDTFFHGISQILPGEMLKANRTGITRTRYFLPEQSAADPCSIKTVELKQRFKEVLKESVNSHLVSDVPLGLFLSGGLDSGAILAMMRSVTDGPIKTFSIGYGSPADAGFNETTSAKLMAERFGADHTEEFLTPDIAELLPRIVGAMDEPFADASSIPTYLVSQVARKHVTVALSGVAGDELFGGYPRYLGMRSSGIYAHVPAFIRRAAAAGLAPLLPERGGHRDQVARMKRFLKTGLLPVDKQYLGWTTFLDPEWADSAFSTDLQDSELPEKTLMQYADIFNNWPSPAAPDRAMGLDIRTYLPDDLLRMGDRLSMAHSLELRVPFCDHVVMEFAFGVPAAVRLGGWKLKSFMRDALSDLLPQDILDAPKRGFMVPIARWLREDLRELVRDLLAPEAIRRRGFLNPEYVQWLLDQHESGRRNFSDQIYALLVLELWMHSHIS